MLEAVRATLAPDDPNALVAELYGVNVYAAGGHFVPHKDTPRGADMLGTLVVCLPVPFNGGDLDVTHHGVNKTFAWAAFFGDIDHEVKQSWGGHRVTLTWLLRRGSGLPRTVREAPGAPFVEAHVQSYHPDTEVDRVGTLLARERHGTTATKLLGGGDSSVTGCFGNEGGYAEFYLYAALLVTVPSWARRRPKRATARAPPSSTKATAKHGGATAAPTGELIATELRAMGHGPAAVRRMLAEGHARTRGLRLVPLRAVTRHDGVASGPQ